MPRNLAITIFEPNEEFREKLKKSIEALTVKTTLSFAKNESELLKLIAENTIDLLIIDHKAVDPKGERIVEQLRVKSQPQKVKKILVTSIHLNEAGKPTEMGSSPLTFVSKPFRPDILESTLIAILELEAPPQAPNWKLDARLLNSFIEGLLENCSEGARLDLNKKTVDLKSKADVCDLSVTSVFDKGDLFGSFTVGFPEKTFLEFSKKISKAEDRSIHQKNIFVAEEFLNSTILKIKTSLESRKIRLGFRSPVVTIGRGHLAPTIQGLKPIVIKFESEEGLRLHLELSLQKNKI
jgi:DNA-binding response OmpR family regulator